MNKPAYNELKFGQQKMKASRGPGILGRVTSRGTGYRVNTLSESQNQPATTNTGNRWA
jgi:hypothetical protein